MSHFEKICRAQAAVLATRLSACRSTVMEQKYLEHKVLCWLSMCRSASNGAKI